MTCLLVNCIYLSFDCKLQEDRDLQIVLIQARDGGTGQEYFTVYKIQWRAFFD